MKFNLLFLILISASLSLAHGDFTVTFDPGALPDGGKIIDSWTEDDLLFTSPNGFVSNDISNGSFPYDGSAYIDFLGDEQPLTITTADALPFSLFSIDLAEYSTAFATPKTITFTGTYLDDSMTNISFTTDGIIDGNGSLQDFQTFTFPSTFTNLKQVTVNTDLYAMDNLKAAVAPEPSTSGLIALASVLLVGGYKRSRFFLR